MKNIRSRLVKYIGIIILSCMLGTPIACASSQTSSSPPTTPLPIGTGQSVTINISAENMAFDKSTIAVPAGADVTVVFTNKDRVPHNVAFYETKAATKAIFIGEVFTGPKIISYLFIAPATPGTYFFRCDVHPVTMTGDFVVTNVDS